MAIKTQRTERRTAALTKARIIEAAIEILDTGGEQALTFRALAARLATGSGAIYWHVSDKGDLLAAATDYVVGHAMTDVSQNAVSPREAIRAVAAGIFDAFDAHPWAGSQLSLAPGRTAMLQIFEGVGGWLEPLGVPRSARFDAWSALSNYILGVAGQNAANARREQSELDRTTLLATIAAQWAELDPAQYPFLREVAMQLPGHDDRAQFLAGIDLILAGIEALSQLTFGYPPQVRSLSGGAG